ncbi:MAG: thiamine phosphate synthase, partial [Terriglobia bacterium]
GVKPPLRARNRGITSLASFVAAAAAARIGIIQIREKDLPVRALCELAGAAIEAAGNSEGRILINDRLDVALSLGAAGVHLGSESLPASAVRQLAPPDFLIGVSCHSVEDALAAESAGADYVLLGPVFETPSKRAFGPPLGLAKLREAAAAVRIPVLALGGITLDRVRPCLRAGARGIAGIRIFQEAPSIAERVAEIRARFDSAGGCGDGPN